MAVYYQFRRQRMFSFCPGFDCQFALTLGWRVLQHHRRLNKLHERLSFKAIGLLDKRKGGYEAQAFVSALCASSAPKYRAWITTAHTT